MFYEFLSIIGHSWTSYKDTASLCNDQKLFLLSFSTAFWSQTGQKKQSDRNKRVEKVDKRCI